MNTHQFTKKRTEHCPGHRRIARGSGCRVVFDDSEEFFRGPQASSVRHRQDQNLFQCVNPFPRPIQRHHP